MLYINEQARWRHVLAVASSLRADDAAEATAATGLPPLRAIAESWAASDTTFVVMFGSVPVGIGGVVLHPEFGAAPWLVGTDLMTREWREFARGSQEFMGHLANRYGTLSNFVSLDNTVHVRWLQWLGCEFWEAVNINGTTFQRFTHVCGFSRHRGSRHGRDRGGSGGELRRPVLGGIQRG